MANVKATVEYKITIGNRSFVLDSRKFELLKAINDTGSLTKASKRINVSYRTALNYIDKMESFLGVKIVNTTKGGKGGGGGTTLTEQGKSVLHECNKLNAIFELHTDVNEIPAKVMGIDEEKGVMTIKFNEYEIKTPLNRSFEIGDDVLALLNYDNIFLMLEPQQSSIRNILKGTITEMRLEGEIIRVNIDVGGVNFACDITLSAEKELNLGIGKKIYLGFKAMSVATLKL